MDEKMKQKIYRMLSIVPDKLYLSVLYFFRMRKRMNWKNPQTFNEKLQWLKLYDRNTIYNIMVDKYEAKQYVADRIGPQYIIPTLGVWDHFDDIDFDTLPDRFVLKCTHDSGGLVICKDKSKFDKDAARKKIEKSLKTNYFLYGREWAYKEVKPRIIAETYMEDTVDGELRDYKLFTFGGVPRIMFVATDRSKPGEDTKFDFFDMNYTHLDIRNGHPQAEITPHKPSQFETMKMLAQKLSDGTVHLRVDFYEVNGHIFFGELTFAHWSGMMPFDPPEWDKKLGDWIDMKKFIGGYNQSPSTLSER